MLLGFVSPWPSTLAWADVIPIHRNAGVGINGIGVPPLKQFNLVQTDFDLVAPHELSLPGPGQTGSLTFGNVTISASAQESISFNVNGDALSLTANGLATSSSMGLAPTTGTEGGRTDAKISSDFKFRVTTPSRYQITIDTFTLTSDETDNPAGLNTFGFSGTGTEFFNRRWDFDAMIDTGSLTGQIEPGEYSLSTVVDSRFRSASVTIPFEGETRAEYRLTLDITPLTPSQTISWTNPTGGLFADTQNWNPQQVPGTGDTAVFDLFAGYAVDLNGPQTVERLIVRDGTVDFNGGNLTVEASSPTVPSVSIENDGRLNLRPTAGLQSIHAIIGSAVPLDAGNPPTAAVRVSNRTEGWKNSGNLAVGGAGHGELFVDGGLVESGSATIGGPFGGAATASGEDSLWKTGNIAVGHGGAGSLNIVAGAKVESDNAVVGSTPGSFGEVTVTGVDVAGGSGSTWTLDNVVTVGSAGATGGLDILDGAGVITFALGIAEDAGSVGRVRVSGRNASGIGLESRLGAQAINIGGNGGLAQMIVSDGGFVSCNMFMNIEQGGSLEIIGPTSLVDVTVDVNVGINSTGLIHINGGNMFVGGLLHVGAGGVITGNGTLFAPNRLVDIGGHIDLGLSPGLLTFDADVALTDTARMTIEMAGTAAGLFDVLAITGDATLDGTLELEFIDGFAPRQGDEFKFLDVGGALSGAFANIEVRNLEPGFLFDLRLDGGGLTMVALNDGVFVPEPATLVMFLLGMPAVLCRRRAVVS
jgi:T5SS/PEP-CTERM-associated repeat protein